MAQPKAKPAVLFDASRFPGLPFDRSAPRFRLSVFKKGQRQATDSRTLSELVNNFSIEEDDKMATNLKITFDNPEFSLSRPDSLIQPGTLLVMEVGYGKGLFGQRRAGEVVRILPSFPRSSKPTYEVQCYDGRQRLLDVNTLSDRGIQDPTRKDLKLPSTFKRRRDVDIIEEIASKFGFGADIDTSLLDQKRRTRVKKNSQSWWDFILKLAQKNDAETWVDREPDIQRWAIRFKKKNHFAAPGLNLVYGETLFEFTPQLDAIGQQTKVQVLHFDRRTKRTRIIGVSEQEKSEKLTSKVFEIDAALVKVKVGGRMQHVFSDKPFKSRKAAQRYAEEYIRRNREDYITARGKTIGIEILQPRQVHKIVTGDARFDGDYYFTQVTHDFPARGVYENSFVAYKVPVRFVVPKAIGGVTKFTFGETRGDNIGEAPPVTIKKGIVDFGDGNLYI